jgi:hypothetical protein
MTGLLRSSFGVGRPDLAGWSRSLGGPLPNGASRPSAVGHQRPLCCHENRFGRQSRSSNPVACPAIGGAGAEPRAAPHPAPKSLPNQTTVGAARIAYYRAAEGPGVFAPRGWHCQTWSGSNGAFIIVTPSAPPQIIPREPVKGRGVMAIESYGGTSGRFDVAEVSARLFPDVMADFIARVKAEGFPSPDFSKIKPYPDDKYTYLNPKLVTFTTPAHHDGIGTGIFVPSADPVRGVVSLAAGDDHETTVLQYDLRLSPSDDRLAQALIDLELQCIGSSWQGC